MRALAESDPEARTKEIIEGVAFATRYGHVPYSEAMAIDKKDLALYNEALAKMIRQENRPRGGAG